MRFLLANYITGGKVDLAQSNRLIPDVHYNPQDPTYAVLEAGITGSSIFLFLMGVLFFMVGGLCFKAFLKNRKEPESAVS